MKSSSFARGSVLALGLAFAAMVPSPAQTTGATTASTNAPHPPPSAIDNDDMQRLKAVRQQVLDANPDLKAEDQKLRDEHIAAMTTPPTPEQKQAMMTEWQAYQKQLRAAMLKIDPTLAPIFAQLDKAHKFHARPAVNTPPASTNAPSSVPAPAQ